MLNSNIHEGPHTLAYCQLLPHTDKFLTILFSVTPIPLWFQSLGCDTACMASSTPLEDGL